MTTEILISYLISGLFAIWVIYRIYQLSISAETLRKAIKVELTVDKYEIENVSKLSVAERIKYAVPLPILGYYNYCFGVITGTIEYVRRVDLNNGQDDEIIMFISILVKKRKVIKIKKFDSYTI